MDLPLVDHRLVDLQLSLRLLVLISSMDTNQLGLEELHLFQSLCFCLGLPQQPGLVAVNEDIIAPGDALLRILDMNAS
jgi:hypothetical protein